MARRTGTQAYLLTYNGLQLLLWTLAASRLVVTLFRARSCAAAVASAYATARLAQTLAWAEPLHAVLRVVRGAPGPAFVQALGRSLALTCTLHVFPVSRSWRAALLLLLAWALGDVARHSLHVALLLRAPKPPPPSLVWLRYSLAVALQPVGIAAELALYLLTAAHIRETRSNVGVLRLPNRWNFSFDLVVFNRVAAATYVYFAPMIIGHMLKQRRDKLHALRLGAAGVAGTAAKAT